MGKNSDAIMMFKNFSSIYNERIHAIRIKVDDKVSDVYQTIKNQEDFTQIDINNARSELRDKFKSDSRVRELEDELSSKTRIGILKDLNEKAQDHENRDVAGKFIAEIEMNMDIE